jgi:uncharacterized protein (TIGR02246 family)
MSLISLAPLLAQRGAGDEAAIREVVQRYLDTRERADAKALEALFTSDVDQLVSSGEWRKGRSDVVRGTLASSQGGGKRTLTVETIRFVASGVALADARYELAGGTGGDLRRMWSTFLLTRESGSWRIAAIRNMLPSAAR